MRRRLVLSSKAREDLRAIVRAYEEEELGLGRQFLAEVRRSFTRITVFPRSAPLVPGVPVEDGARQMQVSGFPYAVVYFPFDGQLRVIAIAHHRRRPDSGPIESRQYQRFLGGAFAGDRAAAA